MISRIAESEFEKTPEMRLRKAYAQGIPDLSHKLLERRVLSAWCQTSTQLWPCALAEHSRYVWSSKGKRLLELVEGQTDALLRKSGFDHPCTYEHRPKFRTSSDAEEIINRILYLAIDPDLRDEDEPAPTLDVIKKTAQLIRGVDRLLDRMPRARTSTFYGEINVTWQVGDNIVRLAVFPDRRSVVQVGSVSLPSGTYRSEQNPSAEFLAGKLESLGA